MSMSGRRVSARNESGERDFWSVAALNVSLLHSFQAAVRPRTAPALTNTNHHQGDRDMRVRAYGRIAGGCRVGIVLLGGLMAQVSLAAPPTFTSGCVTAPIPTTAQSSVVVNLRQQGVISGSAPIQVTVSGILLNGQPTQLLAAGGVNFSDVFGAVCLSVFNGAYTPTAGDVITLQMNATNLAGQQASAN